MRVLRERGAEEIRLEGSPLGSGGEAGIYAVPNHLELVAKIYHRPTSEYADKLAAMLAAPPADPMAGSGHVSIAWPCERLLSAEGERLCVGYLMPRVHHVRLIQEFYNPRARQQFCPLFHHGYLLRTARNLAAAVRALHERGYVVGDLNESNLLVTNQALVTLVDTDSFQVPSRQRVFRCRVGKPEYTPPELQGARFADIDRGFEHDAFGLAVLIFQLLMQGMHPFAGIYTGSGEPAPIPQRIAAGHWPYAKRRQVPFQPSPHTPPWSVLPPSIQELMSRCFEEGHARPARRPQPFQWQKSLQEAEKDMLVCLANTQHVFHRGLAVCPWCALAQVQGRDPFPAVSATRAHLTLRPGVEAAPITVPAMPVLRKTRIALGHPAHEPYPVAQPAPPLLPPQPLSRFRPGMLLVTVIFGGGLLFALVTAALLGWSFTHQPPAGLYKDKTDRDPQAAPALVPARRFTGHGDRVNSVAISPDGRSLLSGSSDHTLRLWDLDSGVELRRFVGHTNGVKSVAFTPDGRRVLSASYDRTLRVWDVETSRPLRRFEHLDQVMSLSLSADGRRLLSGSYDENIRLWDFPFGGERFRIGLRDLVNSVALSPDGRFALCACTDPTIRHWDLERARELRRFTGHTRFITSLALSADGKQALSASADQDARLWDVDTGQTVRTLSGHSDEVTAVAFAGNGRYALTGSGDNTVRLWDLATGRVLRRCEGHTLGVTSIAAGDGHAVSADANGVIFLWLLPELKTIRR